MTLYNLRSPDTITKFDADGNVEASYSTSREACTCPAGQRPTCRHRQMLPYLEPFRDTHWFLDWDHGRTIVDFSGTPKSHLDRLTLLETPPTAPAPELNLAQELQLAGFQVIGLGDPRKLHNTIAEAIGEPTKPWRRI